MFDSTVQSKTRQRDLAKTTVSNAKDMCGLIRQKHSVLIYMLQYFVNHALDPVA